MSFLRSPKMCKSQGERPGLYGGCWSVSQPNLLSLSFTRLAVWGRALSYKRVIPSDSIPRRFDCMVCSSTLSHQETDHTSLLFFACLHFQCWTNTLYTTLTSRAIKKQLCEPVRFHYACFLPLQMAVSIRNISVATFCEECVLWQVFCFHLTVPHNIYIYIDKSNAEEHADGSKWQIWGLWVEDKYILISGYQKKIKKDKHAN